jgi:hypothetical protein
MEFSSMEFKKPLVRIAKAGTHNAEWVAQEIENLVAEAQDQGYKLVGTVPTQANRAPSILLIFQDRRIDLAD